MGSVVDGHAARFLRCVLRTSAGGAAPHEVAVVAAAGVVVDQPGVGLGLELADGGEPAAVEGRSPALLEGGALEPLADSVVVGGAGRDAVVGQVQGGEAAGEGPRDPLGTIVGKHRPDG